MVQPEEQKNREIMQRREGAGVREGADAGAGRLPYPNEVVGLDRRPYHPIGVDALSPLLLHVSFPATREQVQAAIGHARIAVSRDRTRTVAEILDEVAPNEFPSSAEVEAAVARVLGDRDNLSDRRRG